MLIFVHGSAPSASSVVCFTLRPRVPTLASFIFHINIVPWEVGIWQAQNIAKNFGESLTFREGNPTHLFPHTRVKIFSSVGNHSC